MKIAALIAAALGVSFTAPVASAQKIDVKLGLWEVTTTTETNGMPPMPAIDMSKMPPEARARIEAAMKARQAKGPRTQTHRNCLTQEKLDKDLFKDENEQDATCKRTVVSRTSTSQDIKIECSGRMKMTGEARFTATSRESVNGSFKIMSGDGANNMTINSTISAKWLGPACGDVK
jgi:hypothetical protein